MEETQHQPYLLIFPNKFTWAQATAAWLAVFGANSHDTKLLKETLASAPCVVPAGKAARLLHSGRL
jgi:hypothetical protein